MNTFSNKQFKNELDHKYAFYDIIRSCQLKRNSEKPLECVDNCELRSLSKNVFGCNKNLNSIQNLFWCFRFFI